jgi:hypothetical protein
MKLVFFFLFIVLQLLSIGQNVNDNYWNKPTMTSVSLTKTINLLNAIKLNGVKNSTERKLADFISTSIDSIERNKSVIINIIHLNQLFANSKKKLVTTQTLIKNVRDLDSTYREMLIDYLSTLTKIHSTRFQKTILLISDTAQRDIELLKDTYYPALFELYKKEKELTYYEKVLESNILFYEQYKKVQKH